MSPRASALAVLAATLAAAARAAAPAPAPARSVETAAFAAPIPAGWSPAQNEGALLLSGPADENGIRALIVVRRYAADDKTFPDADAYVRRQAAGSRFDPPNAKPAVVTAASVAGLRARRVVKDRPEPAHPGTMDSREVTVREEVLVAPGARGFYVLSYDAPLSRFDKDRGAYASVLKGFKPKE